MHGEINCISTTISMLDDILAYEIEEKIDIENLSFGRSIKIDENKIINYFGFISQIPPKFQQLKLMVKELINYLEKIKNLRFNQKKFLSKICVLLTIV